LIALKSVRLLCLLYNKYLLIKKYKLKKETKFYNTQKKDRSSRMFQIIYIIYSFIKLIYSRYNCEPITIKNNLKNGDCWETSVENDARIIQLTKLYSSKVLSISNYQKYIFNNYLYIIIIYVSYFSLLFLI